MPNRTTGNDWEIGSRILVSFTHTIMHALTTTIAVCIVAAAFEALAAGRNARGMLTSTHQPAWSMPVPLWYGVGLIYYAVLFTCLFRVLTSYSSMPCSWIAFSLLILILIANGVWNWIFFRLRRFNLAFWYTVAYSILCLTLEAALIIGDPLSAMVFLAYVLYLPYALLWTYRIAQLNPSRQ
jgi:tryptophan-rich sensory protein